MANKNRTDEPPYQRLPKAPTGIRGLDEVTGGGLPRGRPTLICGGTGGKTLLAMEFVVRGVILLDNRVANEVWTRYLRMVKYRGSSHGTNEFPLLLGG